MVTLMVMNDLLPPPLFNVNRPSHSQIQLFENLTTNIVAQGHVVKGQGHIWPWKYKVKVMAKVKHIGHIWSLEFNRYVCFSFRDNQIIFGWYSKLHIWPWKVKVIAKVKPDGHISGLEFNRYVCFSFRGNWTIFGWDIAKSIFDLENSRSRSRRKSKPTIVAKMKEIQKVFQKLSQKVVVRAATRVAVPAAGYESVQKHKVTPMPPVYLHGASSVTINRSYDHPRWRQRWAVDRSIESRAI